MFAWFLMTLLMFGQEPPVRLTPIEQAKAWELVRNALPDAARGCEREVIRNKYGEGIVVRCGAANPDPLAPTPMVFLVLDGQAYAASLTAGAVTELPDLSVSPLVRQRAGFPLFVEVIQRKRDRGVETSWQYFAYDPRPVVCIPSLAQHSAAPFVPAQRPKEEPARVVAREIVEAVRVLESRGRVVVRPQVSGECTLTIDPILIESADEGVTARATLRVWERGSSVYEEVLTKKGEDAGEVGEELSVDAVAFLRNNYARLVQRGAIVSRPER